MIQKTPALLVALSTLVALSFSCHVHARAADDLVSTNEVASHKIIGWGAVSMPEYIGAKKNRTGPAFFFEYVDANGFYISTLKGIGLSQRFDMVEFNEGIGYDFARLDKRSKSIINGSEALKGMGEIPGAMTANLGITTRFGENWINFNANAYVATTHREIGNRLTFGMVLPSIKVGSEKFDLDAQWTYGDAKYNQTHFGVSQRQSQQSPFKAYTAKAGLNEIRITAAWLHVWNRHWSMRSSIAGIHLLNDAAKSPIVSRKTMPMIVTTVNYAF